MLPPARENDTLPAAADVAFWTRVSDMEMERETIFSRTELLLGVEAVDALARPRVAFLDHGRIRGIDTPEVILDRSRTSSILLE